MLKWKSKGLILSGSPRAPFEIMEDGSRKKIRPVRWLPDLHAGNRRKLFWKLQEKLSQRKLFFFQDLSARTLQRRADQIPKLIAERKKSNTARVLSRIFCLGGGVDPEKKVLSHPAARKNFFRPSREVPLESFENIVFRIGWNCISGH